MFLSIFIFIFLDYSIRDVQKKCEIDAVEIDDKIAQVAQDYFGLKPDKNMRIHVDDGLKFIHEVAKQSRAFFSLFSIRAHY
jgi:hypothetical protein